MHRLKLYYGGCLYPEEKYKSIEVERSLLGLLTSKTCINFR